MTVATELVVAGIDDVANVLRTALARTARRASAERILGELAAFVPPDALPLVRYCLEHAAAAPTVPELARALGAWVVLLDAHAATIADAAADGGRLRGRDRLVPGNPAGRGRRACLDHPRLRDVADGAGEGDPRHGGVPGRCLHPRRRGGRA